MNLAISLIARGFDAKISEEYVYFAMTLTVFVELINSRACSRKFKPVVLHEPIVEDAQLAL